MVNSIPAKNLYGVGENTSAMTLYYQIIAEGQGTPSLSENVVAKKVQQICLKEP